MKEINVLHYDAFTTVPGKGNPAGIVLEGEQLKETEMQEIAKQIGFNECAFPLPSKVADIRIRYFTPGHEMPLCGHATMATITALCEHGRFSDKNEITIETLAGLLHVQVEKQGITWRIRMDHASPEFVPFAGSTTALANAIGIEADAIDSAYPIVYGSTGTWTLCIPIRNLQAFKQMQPANAKFPAILQEMPKSSVHPFCFHAYDADADMHARHFSSPFSGTIEDSVTGTGSGVMGAYLATYVQPAKKEKYDVIVEQGQEIGKDGRVHVHIDNRDQVKIAISGTAVFVKKRSITLP